ncbi:MAG: IPT/TIG domain-containing protein, partial [Actinobacteria bacterium]|nr:IPT/TIG domain-containing protein [Actinomycetota bacterium]
TVAGNAPTGARDVTVTRPDSQTAKCTGCFTISAAPTVSNITPNTGAQGSTIQNVNIAGTGFANGATPSFSGTGVTVSNVTFNSPTQITATVTIASNAPVGARDVIVTNPDGGTGKFANGFAVTAGPQVISTNPNSITPDANNPTPADVTITGTGFASGATASFNDPKITVNSTDFTDAQHVVAHISVAPGTPHGPRTVTVTNPNNGGAGSCTGCFSIGPEPTVQSISPNKGGQGASFTQAGGNPITIKGTNLSGSSQVSFTPGSTSVTNNGMTVSNVTSPDASTLVFDLQIASNATPGPRDLQITNPSPSGGVSIPGAFTVTKAPTVTGTSPNSAGQGTTNKDVVINGSDFQNPANVSFGPGVTVNKITVTDSTHITANISVDPAAAPGARTVFVTNADGGAGSCTGCFTITGKPTVSSTSPSRAAGSPAADVVITGGGFQQGAVPTIQPPDGLTLSNVRVTDSSHITVTVGVASGAAPGPRNVTVTNPDGGSGSCTGCFTVDPGPTVSTVRNSNGGNSLNPGDTAQTLTIKGANFQTGPGGVKVTFSGSGVHFTGEPTATASDPNTITLTGVSVDANAPTGARNVTVTNVGNGGVGSCTGCFSVGPAPTVSSVSPSSKGAGTSQTLTIKGTNFNSSSVVTFSNSGITKQGPEAVTAPDTITVPVTVAGNATPGTGNVTVTNTTPTAGSGTCTGCFTVNPAPTVTGANPSSVKQTATQNVLINGTGFQPGAAVGFSPATGITVNSTTFNSATSLTTNITVASDAPTGARSITVLNPDGGSNTCTGCFSINTGP